MAIHIAVIEDDVAIAQMYRFKMESSGFKALVAHNGADGLSIIEEHRPKLILLDLRMPVMSGDRMLEKLREKDWGGDIRVIVLTNISKNEAPHSLRFLNVDRYIVKAHTTPGQILDVVNEVLDLPR